MWRASCPELPGPRVQGYNIQTVQQALGVALMPGADQWSRYM